MTDKKSKEIKTGRGGKRDNAGRPKGSQNKVTVAIREIAQPYGKDAIEILAKLMVEADSDQAKIAAAKELLDRGYGKSTQVVDAKVTHRTLAEELAELNDAGTEGH